MKAWNAAVAATIVLGLTGLAQAQQGRPRPPAPPLGVERFAALCAECHGPGGRGARGPSVVGPTWARGSDDASLTRSIVQGYPAGGMPPFGGALSSEEIAAIIGFIRSQPGTPGGSLPLPPPAVPTGTVRTETESFRVETVAQIPQPYGMAFLPDGRLLVTQGVPDALRLVQDGKLLPAPVAGTPTGPTPQDSFGRHLMDVALHPDYRANGWIYLTWAQGSTGPDKVLITLSRGRIRDNRWVDNQDLLQVPTINSSAGRIVFDSDNNVLFGTVDSRYADIAPAERMSAQLLSDPKGKILRLKDDGGVPADNPFVGRPDAFPYVWSYGHREPLGLAFDSQGRLWESEDGPRGGDELNLIRKGANYGWPVITWGHRYDERHVAARTEHEGMEQPVLSWVPAHAVSVTHLYTGNAFPRWRNNLFIGTLKTRALIRVRVEGERATLQETILSNVDRFRDLETGPDGYLYYLSDDGQLMRLVPAVSGGRRAAR